MAGLTDAERKVFSQLENTIRDGKGVLLHLVLSGKERAAIASYKASDGKGSLSVYGFLLSPEERDEITRVLNAMDVAVPAQEPGPLEPALVPFPDADEIENYRRIGHEDLTLEDQLASENEETELALSVHDNRPENAKYVEYFNRKNGRKYTAVSMIQLFDCGMDDTWMNGVCPICDDQLSETGGVWRCAKCGCEWREDGSYTDGGAKHDGG